MSTEITRDLKKKFTTFCREIGGTPQLVEYQGEIFNAFLLCLSAKKFPDPKKLVDLMREASDLSEKFPSGSYMRLFFSAKEGTLEHIPGTHILGQVKYQPEGRGYIRLPEYKEHSIRIERGVPYEYVKETPWLEKELNALLERELEGEKGWDYDCGIDPNPPYSASLICSLLHKTTNKREGKPNFDRILRIIEKFKEVSEQEPSPSRNPSG